MIYLIMGCYFVVVFPFACLGWWLLPAKRKRNYWKIISFFWLLGFFLPLVGVVLIFIIVLEAWRFKPQKKPNVYARLFYPLFKREKAVSASDYGAGGALVRLQSSNFSINERIKALLAVNVRKNRLANVINAELLQSSTDELRLHAYSLLNEQDQKIATLIEQLEHRLKIINDRRKRLQTYKHLAQLYWERIYLNLVDQYLKDEASKKAEEYLHAAQEISENDCACWFLLGRIYLAKHDKEAAKKAFLRALEYGSLPEKVYPYLAEISYKEHDYAGVKQALLASPGMQLIPAITPLVKFWERYASN